MEKLEKSLLNQSGIFSDAENAVPKNSKIYFETYLSDSKVRVLMMVSRGGAFLNKGYDPKDYGRPSCDVIEKEIITFLKYAGLCYRSPMRIAFDKFIDKFF
ncbi:MAG: hypothetical protein AABW45_02060 [Nanoarchaeota archaeon]